VLSLLLRYLWLLLPAVSGTAISLLLPLLLLLLLPLLLLLLLSVLLLLLLLVLVLLLSLSLVRLRSTVVIFPACCHFVLFRFLAV
jgi:hypothetical protein